MFTDEEVVKLRKIIDNDEMATKILNSLNRTLLAGVNPSFIIEKLNSLEEQERSKFINISDF